MNMAIIASTAIPALPVQADTYTKREVRGTWVATVFSIDWPSKKGSTKTVAAQQQEEMIKYLDIMKANNFNAIYFQVRTMCDAFYTSSYEPWSSYLTGVRGQRPTYDPLAFMVEECHKRGMECHAWVNPYRWATSAATASGWTTSKDNTLKSKGMLISYNNGSATTTILNPALAATNERIVNVCKELVENYEIDGIIFDDYFYPSGMPANETAADYKHYQQSGTTLSMADWRRENVNRMVAEVYNMIQETDPSCRFGISPAGAACTDPAVAAKHGIDKCPVASDWQYNGIFSDPVAWLEEGTIDYISPQIYWKTDHSTNPFGPLTKWWSTVAQHFGRHHYASHSLTFLQSSNTSTDWAQVGMQMQYSRTYNKQKASGAIYYSMCDIDGYKASGVGEWLKRYKYQKVALPPAIDWKEAQTYDNVTGLQVNDGILTWDPIDNVKYTVYAIPESVSHEKAESSVYGGILSTYLLDVTYTNSFEIPQNKREGYFYAVCIYDGYNNEYAPLYSDDATGIIQMADNKINIEVEAWQVNFGNTADEVMIVSLTGQVMIHEHNTDNVSLIGLPSGIYVVRAIKGVEQKTQKIFVR